MSGKLIIQGVNVFAGLAGGNVTIFLDGEKVEVVKPKRNAEIPIYKKCVLTAKSIAGKCKESFVINDNAETVIRCDYNGGIIKLVMVSSNPYNIEETGEEFPIYSIKGVRGRYLQVFDDKCVIRTTATFGSFVSGNLTDGEKTIYYMDCIGVQYRPSGALIGYLQLETASSSMNNKNDNFFNENSFTFDTSTVSNEKMAEIAEFIKNKIREFKTAKNATTTIVNQVSAAEELKKFKELLDLGIITQEEFDAKKKQLLGL